MPPIVPPVLHHATLQTDNLEHNYTLRLKQGDEFKFGAAEILNNEWVRLWAQGSYRSPTGPDRENDPDAFWSSPLDVRLEEIVWVRYQGKASRGGLFR